MRVLLLALSFILIAQVAVAAPKMAEPSSTNGNYKNKIQCGYLALEMRKKDLAKKYFSEGEAMFKEQNPKATEMDLAKVFSYERGFLHGFLAGKMGSVSSMKEVDDIFKQAYETMCTDQGAKSKKKDPKKKK